MDTAGAVLEGTDIGTTGRLPGGRSLPSRVPAVCADVLLSIGPRTGGLGSSIGSRACLDGRQRIEGGGFACRDRAGSPLSQSPGAEISETRNGCRPRIEFAD